MDNYIIMLAVILGLILAILAQLFWFIFINKRKFKKQEENLMKQALVLVQRIDEIENRLEQNGGKNKMDKDMLKVAKHLAKKIEEAKEEILEKLDDLSEAAEETPEEDDIKEEKDEELDLDEYDELEDYDGDRKLSDVKKKAEELAPKSKKKK